MIYKINCPENVYTYSEKHIENEKITFLENVKKIKTIPIKGWKRKDYFP